MAPCWPSTTGNNDFFSCNLFGLQGGEFQPGGPGDFFHKQKDPAFVLRTI